MDNMSRMDLPGLDIDIYMTRDISIRSFYESPLLFP